MAGAVTLGFAVSKAAWKLVQAGKATISSGGVRMLDGTLYELAKPVAQSALSGGPIAPITMVSSLANNVQSGFIQHGVNVANGKLDVANSGISVIRQGVSNLNNGMFNLNKNMSLLQGGMGALNQNMNLVNAGMADVAGKVGVVSGKMDAALFQLNSIQASLGMLSTISALSWVSLAVNIAGCGISIAGFRKTLQSISEVSKQIKDLDNKITEQIESEYVESFDRYFNMIASDVQILQTAKDIIDEGHFTNNLAEISSYLRSVLKAFLSDRLDSRTACSILFTLTGAFAQEVQYFTARRYYQYGDYPAAFNAWTETIGMICNDDVNANLRKAVTVDYMDLPTKVQNQVLQSVDGSLSIQMDNMAQSLLLTHKLPAEDFLDFDGYLQKKKDFQAVPIADNEDSVFVEVA